MKVGILGGSFNPIHDSHLRMIDVILEKGLVDEIWMVPCKNHAFDKSLLDIDERVKMIKLATRNNPKIKISMIEAESEGKNYATDTIKKLMEEYRHEFFLIIGSDILKDIKKWHNYDELAKVAKFIIVKREGYPIANTKGLDVYKKITRDPNALSSTEIRERILNRESIENFVPKEVNEYIRKEGLYA